MENKQNARLVYVCTRASTTGLTRYYLVNLIVNGKTYNTYSCAKLLGVKLSKYNEIAVSGTGFNGADSLASQLANALNLTTKVDLEQFY